MCYIDKFSSVELKEAINFMFRWYEQSAKVLRYALKQTAHEKRAGYEQLCVRRLTMAN
jgi:hypothetical protein